MIWLAGSLVYGLAGLVCLRLVTGHLAYRFAARYGRSPNGDQWFGAFCVGLIAGLVWPVALIFIATGRLCVVGAERAAVQQRRAARIKQLEQELNIR